MEQRPLMFFTIAIAIFLVLGALGQTIPGLFLLFALLFYPKFTRGFIKEVKELQPFKTPMFKLSLAFLSVAVLGTFVQARTDINAWATALGLIIVVFLALLSGLVARKTIGELVWRFLIVGSFIATVYIYYDRFVLKHTRAGLLVGCNAAGTLLLIALAVFLTAFLKEKRYRVIYIIGSLLAIYGILLTASRAAWVGMAVLFFSLPLFGVKTKKVTLVLICFALLIAFFVYRVPFWRQRFTTIFDLNSNSSRIQSYKASVDMMLSHPFGIGLSRFQETYKNYIPDGKEPLSHVHNIYLQFGAELGVLGLILSTLIYLYVPYMCFQIAKEKTYFAPIGAGLLAISVRELFDCTTLGLSVALFLWFIFGYVLAEYILIRSE